MSETSSNEPVEQKRSTRDAIVSALPALLAWCGVLASAWVYDSLPQGTALDPKSALFTFFGAPLAAFAIVLIGRAASKGRAKPDRGAELVIAWIVLFLDGVHVLVLALAIGKLQRISGHLTILIAALFLGLAPLVLRLESGSAVGIRTRGTLASAIVWRKTHKVLAVMLVLAACAAVVASRLEGALPLIGSAIPGAIALTAATVYGALAKP